MLTKRALATSHPPTARPITQLVMAHTDRFTYTTLKTTWIVPSQGNCTMQHFFAQNYLHLPLTFHV